MHDDPTAPHRRLNLAAKQVRLAAEHAAVRDGPAADELAALAARLGETATVLEGTVEDDTPIHTET